MKLLERLRLRKKKKTNIIDERKKFIITTLLRGVTSEDIKEAVDAVMNEKTKGEQ